MYTYQTASLTPPQIAAMDRLQIEKQDQIKDKFGQPLVLSKAYFLLRDATQNFTVSATNVTQHLDEVLYSLLVKKGMFKKSDPVGTASENQSGGGGITIARPGTVRMKPEGQKKVSFSDYPLAAKFMPKYQKDVVTGYPDDDKRQILKDIEENLKNLKGYGSQDGKGANAMVYAHYFRGSTDIFITETDFDPEGGYNNLFGFTILNGDTQFAETGFVSLDELVESRRMELDFYWTPVTLAQAKASAYPSVWGKEVATTERDNDTDTQPNNDGLHDVKGNLIEVGSRVRIVGLEKIWDESKKAYFVSPYNEQTGTVRNAQSDDIDVILDSTGNSIGFHPNNIEVELTLEDLKSWEDTLPVIYAFGRKRTIHLPNGEKHTDARYAIVELDDILASHNEETFADTEGYPRNSAGRNLNDRNYASDKGAQQLVVEYARDLNPDLLLSITSGPEGTPIINKKGIVVSGNNRTMSMKLARAKYPQKWQAYQDQLKSDLELFDFPEETVATLTQMSAPVLVRIDYEFGELTTTNMAKYNASAMKAKSPVDRAAELATTLREQVLCETNIPAILGDFDTMGDFYADRGAVKRMIEALRQCSVLNEQDLPAYVDAGFFTEDGKTMLETVLASIILEPDAIRTANRDGVKSMRQVVVNALPVLIQNKNLPASASLIAFINQAILYQGELISSGLSWTDFVNQPKLFEQVSYDRRAVYMNRLMSNGPRKFREAIRKYNDSQSAAAGQSLFVGQVVTPEDAFNGYIIPSIPEVESMLIQRYIPGAAVAPAKKVEAVKSEVSTAIFPAKLSELLRFLKPGMKLKMIAHSLMPDAAGQTRVVKEVRSKDIILTLPNGKDSYLNIPKASGYSTNGASFTFTLSDENPISITYAMDGSEVSDLVDTSENSAPLTEKFENRASIPLEVKLKRAKTTLALLKKALPRLEGARLKTAKTEIALLTRFLKKNR